MILKLIHFTNHIRAIFFGYRGYEDRFHLFTVSRIMAPSEIRCLLIPLGYQYNFASITYRGQVWTCRKLDNDCNHQYHLRFYHDFDRLCTIVTGHWELDCLMLPWQHCKGIDLRCLNETELLDISSALEGDNERRN